MIVFGDPHIEEKNIDELREVFYEIIKYIDNEDVICLGDFYHKNRPTAKELYFGTSVIKDMLNDYNKCILMLTGNHTKVSEIVSSVDYLGLMDNRINVVGDEFFKMRLKPLKEGQEVSEGKKYYFGHKMTEKSDMFFGIKVPAGEKYFINTSDLDTYDYSFLGHQHRFQRVTDKIYQLGACIYTTFAEANDEGKYIAKITDEEVKFIKLKSPIPMYSVERIEDLTMPKRSKVRLVFKDFEYFKKNVNKLEEYKNYFHEFKIKCDFIRENIKIDIQDKEKSLKDIINKWLKEIKDEQVKEELSNEFEKSNS